MNPYIALSVIATLFAIGLLYAVALVISVIHRIFR